MCAHVCFTETGHVSAGRLGFELVLFYSLYLARTRLIPLGILAVKVPGLDQVLGQGELGTHANFFILSGFLSKI